MVAGIKLGVFIVVTLTFFALSECLSEGPKHRQLLEDWESFKLKYEKNYGSDEGERQRFEAFEKNWNKIQLDNERFQKGELSHESEWNIFSDWFEGEFHLHFKRFSFDSLSPDMNESIIYVPPDVEVPDNVDWREKGAVTPVKDQALPVYCRSCYAFSTTGAIEGQHFLKYGKLVSLSEQNIVDCSRKYGNDGCRGGYMWQAYKYVMANHGIDTEESYPYEGTVRNCRFKPSDVGAKLKGYKFVKNRDEELLKKAVAIIGPISVAIDFNLHMTSYKSGIFYDSTCSSHFNQLHHAVLLVGYGTENGQDYWLVKNSFGPKWGDHGYIKLARNRNNNCGIATIPSFPLV